jgi:hypothetical protein
MKIIHTELITHTTTEVDLTQSRKDCAKIMAAKYCEKNNKKCNKKVIEYFASDPELYWRVRNILEKIPTTDFNVVVNKFKAIYNDLSEDWRSALKTGLIIKAKEREGNYYDKPYIFNDAIALELREAGINFCQPVIDKILNN